MNSSKSTGSSARRATCRSTQLWSVLPILCICLAGCSDGIRQSSAPQLARFENAGPSGPTVDLDGLVRAKLEPGPYRVVPGDVLQLELPTILDPQALQAATPAGSRETHVCRVDDFGAIVLPVLGRLGVVGKSLAEIESSVRAEYYPKYVKTLPPVYASLLEHKTHPVSVVGAVARPGIYALRHDQMSLVALLMEAGGIVQEGAAVIRITRPDQANAPLPRMPPPLPSETEDIWRPPRQVSPAMFAGTVATDRSQGPDDISPVRTVFKREGPLSTTGWLMFEDGDKIVARKWLDLGNELQRSTFLATVATKSTRIRTTDLQASLSRLAQHLESSPRGQNASFAAQSIGWTTTRDGHFVASLSGRLTDPFELNARPGATVGEPTSRPPATTLALPVRGLNIPFADVALQAGDSVVVEAPQEQYVSVIGLVNRPGNFPYKPDAQYTLIQALAFAGGLDLTADPRYVSVYRLTADGAVASAIFHLADPKKTEQLTDALAVPLKPGDVVSVEHTPRTRTKVFFDRIFRISLGLWFRPESVWDNE